MSDQPRIIQQVYDEAIPLAKLKEHPSNPRRGRDDVVSDSIDASGFYGAVIVHKRTRHVLAGNTRYRSMKAKGATTIPGFWVTCDDDTATRIMLADNRTSDVATYDDELLASLLAEQASLVGTGYSDKDLAAMLKALGDDVEPLDSSPQLTDVVFAIMIECRDEHHQAELLNSLLANGENVRPVML